MPKAHSEQVERVTLNLGSLIPELVPLARNGVTKGDGGNVGRWCVIRDGVVRRCKLK